MTWTLIMLAIALGLALSGISGWVQEHRREARNAAPIPARQPESKNDGLARPARPAGNHPIHANARS